MLTESERYFYDRGRYGEIAALVDICEAHSEKPCVGGECDGGLPVRLCERHDRTYRVADRLARMRARRRERFSEKK